MRQKEILTLGLHYGHDATAVLLKNGKVVEAMSEERLSRQKKHSGYPLLSVEYIKNKYNIRSEDFTEVSIVGAFLNEGAGIFRTREDNENDRNSSSRTQYYKRSLAFFFPFLKRVYDIRDYFLHIRQSNKNVEQKVRDFLAKEFPSAGLSFIHHHDAHAWATVPFIEDHQKKTLIFTVDGAGDNASGSVSLYEAGRMEHLVKFPVQKSLGLFYCAIVDLLGMKRNEHEFKVMGLAPYAKVSSGEKVYEKFKKLVWFDKNLMTIETSFDVTQATAYLIAKEYNIDHRFDSLAYGVQKLTEEVLKDMVVSYIQKYDIHDIAIGGGVFMNVKANQKILELDEVHSMISMPSSGDESLAIGAAYAYYIGKHGCRSLVPISDIYWGSEYSESEIANIVQKMDLSSKYKVEFFDRKKGYYIEKKVAALLSENSVVGRFSGRAEWGARALGNRSILANPSSRENVKLINEMIKNRDFWMPFATSLLKEDVEKYLIVTKEVNAPYMSITYNTTERAQKDVIAALHPYDFTSRPQIVSREMNKEYYELIAEFKKITGISGVLNTSFNLHGEPNVERPEDAIRTFEMSGLPHLALGDYLISKK